MGAKALASIRQRSSVVARLAAFNLPEEIKQHRRHSFLAQIHQIPFQTPEMRRLADNLPCVHKLPIGPASVMQ
jgi:hypothetical protein